jgi:uncharacterized protein
LISDFKLRHYRQDMLLWEALTIAQRPFRVLSLDGGGMRSIYTAQYLASLADGFSKKAGRTTLDVGSGFDLIVGTSTGAILACALTANIPLARVVQFYNQTAP